MDNIKDLIKNKNKIEIIEILNNKLNTNLINEINIDKLDDFEFDNEVDNIIYEINNPFIINNSVDQEFINLMNYLKNVKEEDLLFNYLKKLEEIKKENINIYNGIVNYFNKYPLWGSLNINFGDLTALKSRAEALKRHIYDYMWLYRRVNDYLSKRTLYAILLNWTILDFNLLDKVKSIFPDYYEPDIFIDNKDDVFVDCGAYIGDSIASYINNYGDGYKKIYAYEISKDTLEVLKNNIEKNKLHDVIVKPYGVGKESGSFFINENNDSSANKISSSGKYEVKVVKLDDDIKEDITFVKMDIEGAEYDALIGLENTIKNKMPKLAICIYHGYKDIYRIPILINKMNKDYKFYIRHNGGNLIPTEFTLLCNK